ncbi:DUF4040 domain-containing protein [Nostoc sp. LEGE 06077]|uniref:DUF4040 domain-containing protein n=1 Tax=Nostoc sp. LEGE 06077 TaxID=915325 RepID=UPI00187E47E5|nr:DUF4040 domain-containing protein [Nostoc sp. LEGE 06077]MBE9207521.1 DUF4040 domain-containing protein [Nostoc sp. LEGE 06077]
MTDNYIYVIIPLLPIAASMLIFQSNPYHALVMRGILGAIAAFIYTILGAADVALTEALVGTMLAITLYAIAVRSSLVMRLGILENDENQHFEQLINNLRSIFRQHYLRLELVPYTDIHLLHQALSNKEVHAICMEPAKHDALDYEDETQPYQISIRIRRIYDIIQTELTSPTTSLSYVIPSATNTPDLKTPVLGEHS